MAWPQKTTTAFQQPADLRPAALEKLRGPLGLAPGKKFSVKNLASLANTRPGGGLADARKRRPKPGAMSNV